MSFFELIGTISIILMGVLVVVGIRLLSEIRKTHNVSSHQAASDGVNDVMETAVTQTYKSLAALQENLRQINMRLERISQDSAEKQGATTEIARDIQTRVSQMTEIMVNKKARGSWGEYQLEFLLRVYMGNSYHIFEPQYKLSNGRIVDVALHMPGSSKILGIDSKFPLENYMRMLQAEQQGSTHEVKIARRAFEADVKRHILDISARYVKAPESIGEACMFVPSEALYVEICSETSDLLDFALSNKVLVCSPTTLLGVVSTLMSATREFETRQNIDQILERLSVLGADAERLDKRAQEVSMRNRQLLDAIEALSVSARKVASHIERITTKN